MLAPRPACVLPTLLLLASTLPGCAPRGHETAPARVDAAPQETAPAAPARSAGQSAAQGMTLFRAGDLEGAEPLIVEALRGTLPRRDKLLEVLAAIYARTDRYRQAEETYREALRAAPDSIGARLGLASVLRDTGRYDEALAAVEEVRRADPSDLMALSMAALLRARLGDNARAESEARELIARKPDDAEARYILGMARLQSGDLKEAEETLLKAHQLDPAHLGALSLLAKVEARLGHEAEARRYEEAHRAVLARRHVEERVRGHRLKAVEAFNAEDYATALQEFLSIAREDPDDAQVHLYLGSTYIALGRMDEARSTLERSLRLAPRSERAYMEMGRLQALQGHYDEAVTSLRQATRINPEFADPHFILAGIHRARGEMDLYEQEMRRFRALRSSSPGGAMQLVVPDTAGTGP
jgi:Flp pilus assembly protein TadD